LAACTEGTDPNVRAVRAAFVRYSHRMRGIPGFKLDSFTLALVAAVVLASVLPAAGAIASLIDLVVKLAVMLLFFLHGARLPREAVIQAVKHWRLQLLILALTFVLFPLVGWVTAPLANRILEPALVSGLLFLCCLPSTVQSSIAFTSLGRGNVPAAACAASASNLVGIFVTPLLTGVLLARQGGITFGAVGTILLLLLVPFVAGQVARPRVGSWVAKRRTLVGLVDRGSILLMVYSAFGKAVIDGVWQKLSGADLLWILIVSCALLALVVSLAVVASRRLRFSHEDEAAIVFCGSMKSLVTGMPMANVLFPGAVAGVLVLPVIVFHQLQLLVCAVLARRYATRSAAVSGSERLL
jgi:sodium/bile acid cotransporter 7